MKIRIAEKEDLKNVLDLNQAALPHVSSVELSDMQDFLEYASPFLVLEENKELVGFMIVLQKGLAYESLNYGFFCNNYDDFDYVDRIVISETSRGNGLGTALYAYLFEHSNKNMVTCEINLKPENLNSMAFHKALGFTQVAEQKTQGGKKSVAMMIRKL